MSKWLVAVLFLVVMFLDGIIFSGLFGFRESFLTEIFLVAMLVYYKSDFWSLVLGVALSGTAEFYWGLKLGTLVLPLLVSAGVFFLLNSFFNIRNRFFIILSGIIMFIVFWEVSIFMSKVL